jgi:hypothetical protein
MKTPGEDEGLRRTYFHTELPDFKGKNMHQHFPYPTHSRTKKRFRQADLAGTKAGAHRAVTG